MNSFDIALVIAIILFARLGMRLLSRSVKMEKEIDVAKKNLAKSTHRKQIQQVLAVRRWRNYTCSIRDFY